MVMLRQVGSGRLPVARRAKQTMQHDQRRFFRATTQVTREEFQHADTEASVPPIFKLIGQHPCGKKIERSAMNAPSPRPQQRPCLKPQHSAAAKQSMPQLAKKNSEKAASPIPPKKNDKPSVTYYVTLFLGTLCNARGIFKKTAQQTFQMKNQPILTIRGEGRWR